MGELFQKRGTVLTIRLPKEVDHHHTEAIRCEADRYIEQEHIREIVFDFMDTGFMDSSGIGMIMGRYRNLGMIGGRVSAIHVNERIYKILYLSGVYKVIDITKKREWSNRDEKKGEYGDGRYE
ncbi:MAG: anti-sigma factor antagonist [Lachnospiraceae bacterium]|nr:anti-sigma factor antagonist [Lachnospiraceae bacterium]MDD3617396.1 anti-sigma factor antagonist [Lachnospiraceae bacterium]